MEERTAERAAADPDVPGLEDVTGYEDGEYFVVCDTENPRAWIRADETTPLDV